MGVRVVRGPQRRNGQAGIQPAQLGLGWAGAFEHLKPQPAPACAAQQQPQRCGRWLGLCVLGAAHEGQRLVARLAGQLQPAQLFAARLRQPRQHGSHLWAAQQLFGGPQGIGMAARAHQQQLAGIEPLRLQRTEAGLERGLHQHQLPCHGPCHGSCHGACHGVSGCTQCFQRWQQQPPLQARQRAEQFGQLSAGPAAPREFGIEPGVPAGQRVLQGGRHGVGTPQAAVLLEQGIKANGIHAKYCT
jgi:hypothetical protein